VPLVLGGSIQGERERCVALAGTFTVERDGFYVMSLFCVSTGVAIYFFLRDFFLPLQHLQDTSWYIRTSNSSNQANNHKNKDVH